MENWSLPLAFPPPLPTLITTHILSFMINTENSSDRIIRTLVLICEVSLILLMMACIYVLFWQQSGTFPPHFKRLLILMALCYSICNLYSGVVVHKRFTTGDQILRHFSQNFFLFMLLSLTVLWVFRWPLFETQFMVPLYGGGFIVILAFRMAVRKILKAYRRSGRNSNFAVFVGDISHISELFSRMVNDASTGYRVHGYFADSASPIAEQYGVAYLGTPSDVAKVLQETNFTVDHIYCTLPTTRLEELKSIINYSESHFIRFCNIPDTIDYVKHTMFLEIMENTPVLSMHNEPLEHWTNRYIKRTFDIVFSLLILVLVFPWIYLIFGSWIKLTSPGPVFFRQKRSGLNGKEFYCLKFRSMRVNADSDLLQASKDDPRKTRVGNIMRKTSIDELPQFINVLRGEMSVVGPRPHMVHHTEEYSRIISNYMVRHFVKPGITGYAQVTGYRGETSELWQMEGRIQRDIWYIENWSLALDLFIIFKTISNAILGEEKAY